LNIMEKAYHKALALADAELSPAELPALVDELARNPSMVRALQVYMAVGRQRLAKAYEAKRAEPVPQWLIDTVMHAPVERAAGQSSKVVSYGSALLERMRRRYRMPGWSLAAGPAFAAVLAAVSAWLMVPNSSHGDTLMTAQLQSALERTATSQAGFRPLLTYWSSDQNWCRQFEVRSDVERTFAIACRADDGNWRVIMQTPPGSLGAILPAGSPREHLDRYAAASVSGQPLELPQVEEAIKSGWPAPPPASK
jgi:hypothetical protein